MSGLEGRDWDMLEAAKRSIREHMTICKDLQNQVAKLKAEKKELIERERLYLTKRKRYEIKHIQS